jgi:hypothetical protein
MKIDTPKINNLTTNGFVKTKSSDGSLEVDTNTYPTTSQALLLDQTTPQAVVNGSPVLEGIQFDTTPSTSNAAEGLLRWNSTDGTLDLGMSGGDITQQIGQELFTKVRNESGYETISNGQAVYISGRTGVYPDVQKARSDSETTSRVLGIATQDIASPAYGYITTTGYVRGIKTDYTGAGIWGTTWVTGDLLYVSKTNAGVLTNVEPDEPHHSDVIGTVGVVSSNQGSILVTLDRHKTLEELTDVDGTALTTTGQFPVWDQTAGYFDFNYNINNKLDAQYTVDVQNYGFLNRTETTISFDGTSLFTLAKVGASWSYYRTGVKYTITTNKTVELNGGSPVDGALYYIYIDSTDGSMTADTGGWTLADTKVPVATIKWNNTLTPKFVMTDERHTCQIDRAWHREHHFVEGTRAQNFGTVSGLTAGSDTPADKTFGITGTVIFDEDLKFTLADITDPDGATAVYPILYRTSSTAYSWVLSDMPFKYTTAAGPAYGFIEYDLNGTSTETIANRFVNTYIFASNSCANTEANPEISTGSTRYFIMQGRGSYTSAALATAEKFLVSAGMPVAEGVALYQLTWATTNRPDTVKGRCRFVSIQQINANNITTSVVTATSHNGLAGLDGGTTNEYYHLTSAEYTGLSGLTASEIAITDASGNLASAAVATYPSLTELAYVKGVTSGIQSQLNGKAPSLTSDENYVTDAQLIVIGNTSGTNTGDNAANTSIAATKLDDFATPDDNTDLNANTTNHGLLVKATAPASGLYNYVGITNGETAYTNKALFDATVPSTQAFGDAAATGSATVAARRDHKHAMPAAPTSVSGNAGTVTVAAETGDTTCSVLFATNVSGSLSPKTNTNLTFNASTGVLTSASAVLTTADINGGTVDNATIGGSTAGAITGTTITANTGIVLPSGSGIKLTLPAADALVTGPFTDSFASGYTAAAGDLVFMGSSSKWLEVDSDAVATCKGLLGIAMEAKNDTQAMKVALPGSMVRFNAWNWTVGATLYAGETLGAMQETIPTGADAIIKVVGFAVDADTIYFNPSPDQQSTVA